jgi:hypothetical protein
LVSLLPILLFVGIDPFHDTEIDVADCRREFSERPPLGGGAFAQRVVVTLPPWSSL